MKSERRELFSRKSSAKKTSGYTIIEVMIFFVITAVLLISALAVFQGQQAKAQFTTGVRETDAQIRTIINEIGSGYFPDQSSFTCTAGPNGPEISESDSDQGTNSGCIFLGKAIQFGVRGSGCDAAVHSPPALSNVEGCRTYNVYSVAGLRQNADGSKKEVQNLTEAQPEIVNDLTETYTIPNGLYIKRLLLMSARDTDCRGSDKDNPIDDGCDIGALAYYQSLGNTGGSSIVSGTKSIDIYPISNTLLGQTEGDFRTNFEDQYNDEYDKAYYKIEKNPDQGIILCLSDGSRNAAIQIGTNGRVAATDVLIDGVPTGCEWGQ